MRPYAFWPTVVLQALRGFLVLFGVMPMEVLRLDIELGLRETGDVEEFAGFWCPAAAGVA